MLRLLKFEVLPHGPKGCPSSRHSKVTPASGWVRRKWALVFEVGSSGFSASTGAAGATVSMRKAATVSDAVAVVLPSVSVARTRTV